MVKSMYKYEFADKFYSITSETLRLWINENPELLKELEKLGYKKRSKLLKPKEISLIREHFG